MLFTVLAVYDAALAGYNSPFVVTSPGVGIRSFSDEVMRSDSPMNQHPADYSLWLIGSFDSDSGKLDSMTPQQIARAVDFMRE